MNDSPLKDVALLGAYLTRKIRPSANRAPMSDDAQATHLETLFARAGRRFDRSRFSYPCLRNDDVILQLSVIDTPNPKGVFVFMPGTNAYALVYAEVLCAWADAGYAVVAFDPRGHGRSTGARGSYTVTELLSDMNAVVAYARARYKVPVFVGGSSQGGIVALYAATADKNLAGVFSHNVADFSDPESVQCSRNPALFRKMRGALPMLAGLMPELPVPLNVYLDLKKEMVSGLGTAWDMLLTDPLLVPFVRLKTLATLASTPPPGSLESMKPPVFVLHGGQDQMFPRRYIDRIFARIGSEKTMKLVPDGPHYVVVDCVKDFAPDLIRWADAIMAKKRGTKSASLDA